MWYFDMESILIGLQEHPISFGGLWYYDMFRATYDNPVVHPTGSEAGGHQWVLSGYNVKTGLLAGECWWGSNFGRNGRFYISVRDFRVLLEAYGDAHYTYRKKA